MTELGVQYYPRAVLTCSPWILRMSNDHNPETGYVRSTYKNGHWSAPVPISPMPFNTHVDNSSQPQPPELYTGSSTSIVEPNAECVALNNCCANGWGITQHQPTWSQCEELEKTVLNTVRSQTPTIHSDSVMEQSLLESDEVMNYSFTSEQVEHFSVCPPTPLGMTCCCDSVAIDFGNCPISLAPGQEIPLCHLFVKSIMEPQELESPEGSFHLFQRHIQNHLESGGTITMDKPLSSWMTLMGVSYNLVISSGLLTGILPSLRSKEGQSPYLPRTGVSPPTSIHPIGGVSQQLKELAETLFGGALVEYWSTRLRCKSLSSVTRNLFGQDTS